MQYAGIGQLRKLFDAMMAIGTDLDLPVVLEQIVTAARDLVDAKYAALGVLDPTRTYLSQFITVGLDESQRQAIGELPKGHGILGLLILDPKPIRMPDLGAHPDSFGFPPNHPPMGSFLGVPLHVRGEVFGNLYLTDKRDGGAFSDIDEELVVSLAAAAAVAIDNARLHERTQELSLLADRERIAHDLHDTVIQRLVGSGLTLQSTLRLVERPEVAERIHQVVDDLDDAVRQLRSAIFELDTRRAPGRSIRREVLDVTAEAGRALGFEPNVTFDGPIDNAVKDSVANHLVAVLRESLSNVARHAAASKVEVSISAESELVLEVVDDGVGVPEGETAGNGLRNMQKRADALGGSVTVQGTRGHGTSVRWAVPLPV